MHQEVPYNGFHIALTCTLCNTIKWPDTKLVYKMAFGFDMLGSLEDSWVYKPINPAKTHLEFEQIVQDRKVSNLAWLDEVEAQIILSVTNNLHTAAAGGDSSRFKHDRLSLWLHVKT